MNNRFDRELENLVWVTKHFPSLFLDEEREYDDENLERHRRLKMLIKAVQNLNPKFTVQLRIVEEELVTPPDWWKDKVREVESK